MITFDDLKSEAIQAILIEFNITLEELLTKSRKPDIALVRGVLAYILWLQGMTLKAVGEELGGMKYSTVMYHRNKYISLVDSDYMPHNLRERRAIQIARKFKNKYFDNLD